MPFILSIPSSYHSVEAHFGQEIGTGPIAHGGAGPGRVSGALFAVAVPAPHASAGAFAAVAVVGLCTRKVRGRIEGD